MEKGKGKNYSMSFPPPVVDCLQYVKMKREGLEVEICHVNDESSPPPPHIIIHMTNRLGGGRVKGP